MSVRSERRVPTPSSRLWTLSSMDSSHKTVTEFEKEEKWLLENLKGKDGVRDVLEVKGVRATSKGDNNSSEIIRMKTVVRLDDGSIQDRSYVAKKQTLFLGDIFGTEIKMYTDVLPKMMKKLISENKEETPMWGKLICCNENKTILLFEDLKEQGYLSPNRLSGLDVHECSLILRELGRFHALGAAMLEAGEINVEDFSKWELRENETLSTNWISSGLTCLVKVMKDNWDQKEWKDIIDRIEALIPHCCDKFFKAYDEQSKCKSLRVLTHGDFWVCNLMIKYSPLNGAPTNVKFVDFQVSHISTFGWDISNFLHSTCKAEFRRTHRSKLLEEYLESLTQGLKSQGFPEDRIPKMVDLEDELRRIEYWTFILVTCFYPATIAPADHPFNIEALSDKSKNYVNLPLYQNPKFVFSVQEDLKNLAKSGVI